MSVNPSPLTRRKRFDVRPKQLRREQCVRPFSLRLIFNFFVCHQMIACRIKTHRNTVARDITYTPIALLNVWNVSVILFFLILKQYFITTRRSRFFPIFKL